MSFTILILAVGCIITLMITVSLMALLEKTAKKRNDKYDEIIKQKQTLVSNLNEQIETKTIDRTVSLSKGQINVLDMYDQSNIRIPADILEDLSQTNIHNEKEVYDFIENQRHFWKLENTKKPYRRK